MRIYTKFVGVEQEILDIDVAEAYQEHAEIVQETKVFDTSQDISVKTEVLYTSGLHLVESFVKAKRDVASTWFTDGTHVRYFFFIKGDSAVRNGAGNESYQHEVGMLQRNFLDNAGGGGVSHIKADSEVHHVVVKMSLSFYRGLLRNEGWVDTDPFHHYVMSGVPLNRPNEIFYMNLKILDVLQDIFGSSDMGIHRLQYVKMKLRELIFLVHLQRVGKSRPVAPAVAVPQEILEKICFYIALNLDNPPSVLHLSKKFMLNEKKLKEAFKQMYGCTIYSLVIQLRMEKAKKLLLENYNVNELSAILGYQSVSHFIKIFKSYHGYTPKEALKKFHDIAAQACKGLKIGLTSSVCVDLLLEYVILF